LQPKNCSFICKTISFSIDKIFREPKLAVIDAPF
jgi:hypothetical protein